MHRITKRSDRVRVRVRGSAVVLGGSSQWNRHGNILNVVFSCRDWTMKATLRPRYSRQPICFRLDDGCKWVSDVEAGGEFDTMVEETVAKAWGKSAREGWRMTRETGIWQVDQPAFFPDFAFANYQGWRAMLEIVSSWPPERLISKFQILKRLRDKPVFLAVAQSWKERKTILSEHPMLFNKGRIEVAAVQGL